MIPPASNLARTTRAIVTSGRGLTLLEVVLALTTLVIAATALLGGSSFAANLAARDQRRLEATEVAHRLILQHIEEPDFFKGEVKRTEINGRYYAFSLDEDVVSTDDTPGAQGSKTKYRANPLATTVGDMERLKQANRITVRVYPDDDNTGIGQKIALAELTRYYVWIGGVIDEDNIMRETLRRVGKGLDASGLGNTTPK